MSRPTYMKINLAALSHNLLRVRELAPHCKVMAMVKANAYGHGMVAIAKALSAADAFGVASLDEGLTLRQAGIQTPIVLIEGLFDSNEIAEAAAQNFTLVVHHLPHVEMLEAAKLNKAFSIWLKINTGMHRLGFEASQFPAMYQRLLETQSVKKPIGLMTHLAEADCQSDDAATMQQIALFNQLTAPLLGPRSLANSAGIIAWPTAHGDFVRPGLMLYGASPFYKQTGFDLGLEPVMTLWSRIIAIQHMRAGAKIGYGGTWTAPHDIRVGVVGVGYGDGYPQSAQNGTPTLVRGKYCPLVGRVSMDMLTIDLSAVPEAQIGDPVTLWGVGLPVEHIAQHSRSSAYEILTRMTPRPKIEIAD